MARRPIFAALFAFALVVAACGRAEDDTSGEATTAPAPTPTAASTTAAPPPDTTVPGGEPSETTVPPETTPPTEPVTTIADPCAGVTLEATEIGVSEDTLTVLVMADTGSELAPGLFQGAIDGVKAWAADVNANGGLGCREVEVLEWDSKILPGESINGYLEACAKASAMIGSNSLFIPPEAITSLETCPDKAGAATGFLDLAALAVDALHQCSPNLFTLASVAGSCPYSGEGERTYGAQVGPYTQYTELLGGQLHGVYLVPNDLPSTIASSMPTVRGLNQSGLFVSDAEFGASGRAEQATYAEYIAAIKTSGSNIAVNGSNDQAMIKLRTEAKAQGLDESAIIWACSLACYTESLRSDPNADGTYAWLSFLPFNERDLNPDMDAFLTAMGTDFPPSWAVTAWNSGRAYEQVINAIVAADGPNAITRARILEETAKITAFDNNGWISTSDLSQKALSPCYVLTQLVDGDFKRIYPEEPGTLDCNADNIVTWTGDSLAEFGG